MENLNEYVTTIKRSSLEGAYVPPSGNCFILPMEFYKLTKNIVKLDGEMRGVLLCKENDSFLIVHSLIEIGRGNSGGVFTDPKRLKAINKLLQDNLGKGVRAIDFHTHVTSTPRYYDDKFSDFLGGGGDFGSFREKLERNPDYLHVLFTPTHILTFGKSKPSFALSGKPNPDVWNFFTHWNKEFGENLLLEK